MNDIKAKQQVVDKIKESTNILITVSDNPSVDALSAAIGLTLLLDKLDKHATAVFSGTVPPALAFLEPDKILDDTTDSLRDFIIALDKDKADHLRYKVDGDSVKIFITPYKTTITSDDLEFSQGDYNVELVIALGVDVQEHLDKALESHGQILHDATVITVTAGDQASDLGGIDWHDDQASSLSEMVAGLSEALKSDKNKSLLDKQISTAMLTGIVAQTDRFSNTHTTSRVMTIAAQLMAGGADQQLIATKLEEKHEVEDEPVEEPIAEPEPEEEPRQSLTISHKPNETLEELDKRVKAAEQAEAEAAAQASLDEHTTNTNPSGIYSIDHDEDTSSQPVSTEVEKPVATPIPTPTPTPAQPQVTDAKASGKSADEPTLGGTLNATAEQAAEEARREQEGDQNKVILSHAYLSNPQDSGSLMNANETSGTSFVLGENRPQPGSQAVVTATIPQPGPAELGLPMPPPVPDFSATPPVLTGPYAPQPSDSQPERLGDILNDPIPPVTPTSAYAPDLPVEPSAGASPTPTVADDPGQFKIPGQQ